MEEGLHKRIYLYPLLRMEDKEATFFPSVFLGLNFAFYHTCIKGSSLNYLHLEPFNRIASFFAKLDFILIRQKYFFAFTSTKQNIWTYKVYAFL